MAEANSNFIPKIIHYCWLSNDPIPQNLKDCMETWKEKLPDYEFILWNFDRFDKKSSLWVQQAFDNKKYAFAADYIRLFAVYNYGGFYMDMDIKVLKTFNDLLNQNIAIAFEDFEQNGIEAGCFGAEKQNPYIADCLTHYKDRSFIKADGTFDTTTLPKIMSSFLPEHKDVKPLDWHTFTNKSYVTGKIETTADSYAIHNFAGSWLDSFEKSFTEYVKNVKNKNSFLGKLKIIIFHFFYALKFYGIVKGIKNLRKK